MTRSLVRRLPAGAACLAEASWIAVLVALVVAFDTGGTVSPALRGGPWALLPVVAIGMTMARRAGPAAGWRIRLVPAVVALAGGAVAAAAAGAVPAVAAAGFLGLAAWRGTRHADPSMEDSVASELLRIGTPALALPWLVGAAIPGSRAAFVEAALPATLLFVASSLAAIGLTRLDVLGRESGLDWTSNRAWLLLLGGTVALLGILAVPAAWLLGVPASSAVRTLLAPVAAVVQGGAELIRTTITTPSPGAPPLAPGAPPSSDPLAVTWPAWVPNAVWLVLLVALVAGAIAIARRVRGTSAGLAAPSGPATERRLDITLRRPHLPGSLHVHLHLSRRRRPRTATEAYVAADAHLARAAATARGPGESARGHARRLAGAVGWRLALLAADYELERYASRSLSDAETRRAIARSAEVRQR